LPSLGLTLAYSGNIRLECVCSPKDTPSAVAKQDTDLAEPEQEYAFECLVFKEDSPATDSDATNFNQVPEGCISVDNGICPSGGMPLPVGTTLPEFSTIGCENTDAILPWQSGCMYMCPEGRQIQCICGGDLTSSGLTPTWYCRNFVV
jgi:hypothetical protein